MLQGTSLLQNSLTETNWFSIEENGRRKLETKSKMAFVVRLKTKLKLYFWWLWAINYKFIVHKSLAQKLMLWNRSVIGLCSLSSFLNCWGRHRASISLKARLSLLYFQGSNHVAMKIVLHQKATILKSAERKMSKSFYLAEISMCICYERGASPHKRL